MRVCAGFVQRVARNVFCVTAFWNASVWWEDSKRLGSPQLVDCESNGKSMIGRVDVWMSAEKAATRSHDTDRV